MSKHSKNPRYDDPSAFKQQFPLITEVKDGSLQTPLSDHTTTRIFKMGKCGIILHEADEQQGWFMSVQRTDRYSTWDELVWIRYNLIPDAARMSMILPNLNNYINQEDTTHKNVFTMEQTGWLLDPPPQCCNHEMMIDQLSFVGAKATFHCGVCANALQVNFNTWNEEHGNGFKGKVKAS